MPDTFAYHWEGVLDFKGRIDGLLVDGVDVSAAMFEAAEDFLDRFELHDHPGVPVRVSACGTSATSTLSRVDVNEGICHLARCRCLDYGDVVSHDDLIVHPNPETEAHVAREKWNVVEYLRGMRGQHVEISLDIFFPPDLPDRAAAEAAARARNYRTVTIAHPHAGSPAGSDVVVDRPTFGRLRRGGMVANTDPAFKGGWAAARPPLAEEAP